MAPDSTETRRLLHVFPTFDVGGSQRRFVQIANALGRKYAHTILALDGNFAAVEGLEAHVPKALETIPQRKTATISLMNVAHARRVLRRVRPDLLLTYNWGAIEWVIANSLPTFCRHVHLEDGFGTDEPPGRQFWRRTQIRRLLLPLCDRVIVPSILLQDIATRAWRLPPHKVSYLPNGIDCGRFASNSHKDLTEKLGIPESALVVGTVAALRKEKNLRRLVRVFASLPDDIDARLIIVGDGPERSPLREMAAGLNVDARIVFVGALSNPERLLGRFDVFALTSDTEQMPYSILEAMAAGLPVAATDVGDVRRMLSCKNADFVVSVEEEESLTHGLARLLRNSTLRAQIGRANQHRVRLEYALDQMVRRYDDLFSGSI